MIKNIIFDIGNVIAYFSEDDMLKSFTPDKDVQEFLRENVVYSPEWVKYGLIDLGYISLDQMGDIICDRTDHVHDELVKKVSKEHINFIVTQSIVLDLIKKIRKNGYKVYILSNTNESAMTKHQEVIKNVDGYVLSYQVHMIKPHIGIYKELLNKYNLKPEECIFLDDKNDNAKTACKLGIHGERVLPNNFDSIIDVLKKYNIKID